MAQGFGNGSWSVGRYGQWSYVDAAVEMDGASSTSASAIKSQGTAVVMSAVSTVTILAGQVYFGALEIDAAATISINARHKWVEQNIAATNWVVQPTRS
tara:strand:+ start:1580 stop:1876 length:297 start_codon:yes stop_codon:yes gene_type:complete